MAPERRGAIAAAFVFAATLGVYLSGVPANPGVGDEAEAQTVPYILGVAHPTGFPAYTLAGWLFSHAVAVGTVAWRLNAFAGVCAAFAAAGVALLGFLLCDDAFAATAAALAFAFGRLVWRGADHANTQNLTIALSIFALAACVAFARTGRGGVLVAACACVGLGLAGHPTAIWMLPAIAVAALWQRRSLAPRVVLAAFAALLLPLALYAYFPLRSNVIAANGLDPAAAPPLSSRAGSLDWDTNATRTWNGFLDEVLGRREHATESLGHVVNPQTLPAAAALWWTLARREYWWPLLVLAALGVAAVARRDPRALTVVAAGTLGTVAWSYQYRLDTHLDRYAVLSLGVAAAFAAAAVRAIPQPRFVAAARATAIALLALFAVAAFVKSAAVTGPAFFDNGATVIAAVAHDTPDNAIVVAQWNDAAALGYGSFVERSLGHRIVVAGWPDDFPRDYPRWSESRPVVLYVSPLGGLRMGEGLPPRIEQPSSLLGYHVYLVRRPSPLNTSRRRESVPNG